MLRRSLSLVGHMKGVSGERVKSKDQQGSGARAGLCQLRKEGSVPLGEQGENVSDTS